jgi:uncharacterized protein YbaP (TraB family)
MITRLDPLLQSGKTFIAVGAAHLAGEKGLLEAFRNRGYAVTPVLGGKKSQWLGR